MDEVDSSPIAGILRKYRRDIACFIMAILAVLFCASEWCRVQGAFGQVLHAMASGLFGLTSVILPVFLALVVFSLMRKTQNKDENLHMALGWFMILWSVCSILAAAIASASQEFDMSLLQRAGGLLGYVLGCPLAWGLSKGFSIAIFVVVILFSLLLITHTRVTQIPDKAKALAAKFVGTPKNRDDIDDEAEQFPNEVRVGGTTLAFAEGVPAHDGTDADGENDDRPGFLTRMKQRFASHKSKNVDDGDLDHYAGDEAFLNAAERHGQTAETIVDEPYQQVDSPRSISSDDYRADDYDSDDYSAAAPSGTTAMPQNGRGRSFSSAPIGTASGTMPSVAAPVPSSTLSNCTLTVPSCSNIPALIAVWVASTSTAAPNTTGRPAKSPGAIGQHVVAFHRSAEIMRSAMPTSRRLAKARAQPALLSPDCWRKSANWRKTHNRPAAGCHRATALRSSGSSSSGKPKSNHAVRSGTSPARKPSNRVLKNVEAAVPSVEVIHI